MKKKEVEEKKKDKEKELQPFEKRLAVPDLGDFENKQSKIDPNLGFAPSSCSPLSLHIMPPKGRASKASKNHPSRKSTRKVQKTARFEQA